MTATGKTTYMPVAAHYVGTVSNYGTCYDVLGPQQSSAGAAIRDGFQVHGSDDFNIAVIADGRLVEWRWMNDAIVEEDEVLAEIGRAIGLSR